MALSLFSDFMLLELLGKNNDCIFIIHLFKNIYIKAGLIIYQGWYCKWKYKVMLSTVMEYLQCHQWFHSDPNCVLLAQVYRFLSRKDDFSGWFTIYIRQIGRNTAYHITNYHIIIYFWNVLIKMLDALLLLIR